MIRITAALAAVLLTSCATTSPISATPINAEALGIHHVCIVENRAVTIADVPSVIHARLQKHGITSELVDFESAPGCDYMLTYTVRRAGISSYISLVQINVLHNGTRIGSGEYNADRELGFLTHAYPGKRLTARTTADQINPVIDRTFGFPSRLNTRSN